MNKSPQSKSPSASPGGCEHAQHDVGSDWFDCKLVLHGHLKIIEAMEKNGSPP